MLHYPIIIKITAKNEAITELFTLSLQICKSGYLCADFQLEAETETETKFEPETRNPSCSCAASKTFFRLPCQSATG